MPFESGIRFADYALHFILKVKEPLLVEAELKQLKLKYQGHCHTYPHVISVHPCLLKQFEKVPFETPENTFAHDLKAILIKNRGAVLQVATMTSKRNNVPWKFMLLNPNRKAGILEPAVQIALDPTSLPQGKGLSSQAKEHVFFRGIGGTLDTQREQEKMESDEEYSKYVNDYVEKYTPIFENISRRSKLSAQVKPNFDSLEIFLRTFNSFQTSGWYRDIVAQIESDPELKLNGLKNIELTKNRPVDLFQTTDRIENPDLNNEFTVDCTSCHIAHTEKQQVIRGLAFDSNANEKSAEFQHRRAQNVTKLTCMHRSLKRGPCLIPCFAANSLALLMQFLKPGAAAIARNSNGDAFFDQAINKRAHTGWVWKNLGPFTKVFSSDFLLQSLMFLCDILINRWIILLDEYATRSAFLKGLSLVK